MARRNKPRTPEQIARDKLIENMVKGPLIQETLASRAGTHGDFRENGRIMQRLKDTARTGFNWPYEMMRAGSNPLTPEQCEAIDMIFHKVGRILSGNPNEPDHWFDIAGYATLIVNILETGKSHT